MSRKQALAELIAKVEAGDFPTKWGDLNAADVAHMSYGLPMKGSAWGAFHGSLDAAKALHEAVLPGWIYNLAPGFAHVLPPHDNGDQEALTGLSDYPARAWLLAILRALHAQEGGEA